jgi:DNA-directed RNA polymerase subunit RPC12/RpoP
MDCLNCLPRARDTMVHQADGSYKCIRCSRIYWPRHLRIPMERPAPLQHVLCPKCGVEKVFPFEVAGGPFCKCDWPEGVAEPNWVSVAINQIELWRKL